MNYFRNNNIGIRTTGAHTSDGQRTRASSVTLTMLALYTLLIFTMGCKASATVAIPTPDAQPTQAPTALPAGTPQLRITVNPAPTRNPDWREPVSPTPAPPPIAFAEWELYELAMRITPELTARLGESTWVADGFDSTEIQTVTELIRLAKAGQENAVQRLLDMPFLRSIESSDLDALKSLKWLHQVNPEMFRYVMNHPTVARGITDQMAHVIATLPGPCSPPDLESDPDCGFLKQLLDPEIVTLELRDINLPLAGRVQLTIVRTLPGSVDSMDHLQNAVYAVEKYLGEPFPVRNVYVLFADFPPAATGGGLSDGVSITIRASLDVTDDQANAEHASRVIVHEVAHYYWVGNSKWLDEGAAELMAVTAVATSFTYTPNHNCPILKAYTEAALEELETPAQMKSDSPCFQIWGVEILSRLLAQLGVEEVKNRLQELYRRSQNQRIDATQFAEVFQLPAE